MKLKRYSYSIKNRVSERNLFRFRYCGNLRGKKVLDVGCGNGWFERYALSAGAAKVFGIDTNSKFIEEAAKNVPQAFFTCASAEKLNFKNDYFDMVVMFDVLEHFGKKREVKVLKECHRVLKRNGSLIIATPNCHMLSCLLDPAWFFGHRHYLKKVLHKLLVNSGFRIVKFSTKGGFYYVFSMILDYLFKWIFNLENPFRNFLESRDNLDKAVDRFVFNILEAKPQR